MEETDIVTFVFLPQGVLRAKGFDSLGHAEAWGHRKASELSVLAGRPIYLGTVSKDSMNFICCTTAPEAFEAVKEVS